MCVCVCVWFSVTDGFQSECALNFVGDFWECWICFAGFLVAFCAIFFMFTHIYFFKLFLYFSHFYYFVMKFIRSNIPVWIFGHVQTRRGEHFFAHVYSIVILCLSFQSFISIPAKTSSRDKTTFRAKTQKGLCLSSPFCHLKPDFELLSCIQQNELAV